MICQKPKAWFPYNSRGLPRHSNCANQCKDDPGESWYLLFPFDRAGRPCTRQVLDQSLTVAPETYSNDGYKFKREDLLLPCFVLLLMKMRHRRRGEELTHGSRNLGVREIYQKREQQGSFHPPRTLASWPRALLQVRLFAIPQRLTFQLINFVGPISFTTFLLFSNFLPSICKMILGKWSAALFITEVILKN